MFNVIVVSYYFPPMGLSGVQRTLKFVKYMPDYNWRPTVVTTGKTGYFAHDNTLLIELEGKEIEIVRTEGFDPNSLLKKFGTIKYPRESVRKLFNRLSQTFFIPDNKISWAKKALIKVEEWYDLLDKGAEPRKICEKQFPISLGLSATPTVEGRPEYNSRIRGLLGDTLDKYSLIDALNDGHLCPFEYNVHTIHLTPKEQQKYDILRNKMNLLKKFEHTHPFAL